jgi:hypothetical protein
MIQIPVVLSTDNEYDYEHPRIVVDIRSYFLGDSANAIRDQVISRLQKMLAEMPPIFVEKIERS